MSTLTITVGYDTNGAVQIHPDGEIDADNCHELRETVGALLATETPRAIRVDMSLVKFIDSVGVGALVGCYHAAAASGVRLVVTNPTGNRPCQPYEPSLPGPVLPQLSRVANCRNVQCRNRPEEVCEPWPTVTSQRQGVTRR